MYSKILKIIVFTLAIVLYGSLLVYKIDLPAADDIARHIINGEMILQGRFDLLYKNFYSYTQPAQSVVNHHWLSGVVYFLVYNATGWSGLVLFKVALLLLTFALLFKTATRKANFWLVGLFSLPTIFILGYRIGVRPENFSYLFIVICLYLLSYLEEHPKSKTIFWLIPLQLLWVNLHIFFFISIALVGGYLIETMVIHWNNVRNNHLVRKLLLLLVGLVLTSLVNPNGIKGALYPLNIFRNYGVVVSENQSIPEFLTFTPISQSIGIKVFAGSVVMLGVSFIFGLRKKRKPYFYLAAGAATIVSAASLNRTLPLFALIFLPTVSSNFNDLFYKSKAWLQQIPVKTRKIVQTAPIFVLIVTFAFCIIVSSLGTFTPDYIPGIGLSPRSEESAKFFKDNNLKGPIFNDYDIGSYLIYNLFPQEKVFVDNRPEAYTTSFFQNTYFSMLTDDAAWQEGLNKYRFNTLYFYQYNEDDRVHQFIYNRARDPDWALVFADIYTVIFVRRTPANSEIIQKFQITPTNVPQRMGYLATSPDFDDETAAADVYNVVGRPDLAQNQLLKIVLTWPHKGRIWQVMGQLQLTSSDPISPVLAMMFLERAIAEGYKTADGYTFLGAAYMRMSEASKARDALKEAIKINPDRQDAQELLHRINGTK